MKTLLRPLACAIALAAMASPLLAAPPATLPAFAFPDLDGKVHSSAEWRGKPVVIDFWAGWCETCKESVPQLLALQKKFKGKGLVVVGVSVDKGSAKKVARAAQKFGITYLVLRDPDQASAKIFGYNGIPSVYAFDAAGKLVKAMPGYAPEQEAALAAAVEGMVK